jgi:hypothetical protein
MAFDLFYIAWRLGIARAKRGRYRLLGAPVVALISSWFITPLAEYPCVVTGEQNICHG